MYKQGITGEQLHPT